MQTLSYVNFLLEKEYIFTQGRELEQKLLAYEFDNRSAHDVIKALEKHQNEDGGFQDMGEGDQYCSSPIGTSVAFQHLVEIGASSNETID